MAEWLGRGLQNLVQRFESACRLSMNKRAWSRSDQAFSLAGKRACLIDPAKEKACTNTLVRPAYSY